MQKGDNAQTNTHIAKSPFPAQQPIGRGESDWIRTRNKTNGAGGARAFSLCFVFVVTETHTRTLRLHSPRAIRVLVLIHVKTKRNSTQMVVMKVQNTEKVCLATHIRLAEQLLAHPDTGLSIFGFKRGEKVCERFGGYTQILLYEFGSLAANRTSSLKFPPKIGNKSRQQ